MKEAELGYDELNNLICLLAKYGDQLVLEGRFNTFELVSKLLNILRTEIYYKEGSEEN